jgi:hypothetical protein
MVPAAVASRCLGLWGNERVMVLAPLENLGTACGPGKGRFSRVHALATRPPFVPQ